jgi:glycosyltransferase involved in cell wall biosynthesis
MRIALVTDAWRPQVNGVVRTYENVARELARRGDTVDLITPEGFATVPCPSYPSIRLAVLPGPRVARLLGDLDVDAIHVATEGPLGHAARACCLRHGMPFTTSFHTQFPEYIRLRAPIPIDWSYAYLRRFHGAARRTLVPTPSQRQRLVDRGFGNIVVWSRGVDTQLFRPRPKQYLDLPRPIFITVGRVAIEKNIEAFLRLDLPGSKLVVGDGPDLKRLAAAWPAVRFTGFLFGEELAAHLAAADVFVFPSLTDTFGIVLLEAMACGVPVAAHPVTGPIDVIENGVTGFVDNDLRAAALAALELDPQAGIAHAAANSWRDCADSFRGYLSPLLEAAGAA